MAFPVIVQFRQPGRLAAALIALLMMSYASVVSTVMQAAVAAPAMAMPMCDGGVATPASDMAPPSHASRRSAERSLPQPSKACPYCAAAAHPPLASQPVPPLSSTAVQFVAYRVQTLHGPRGPPAPRPKARDPPTRLLSL